MVTYIFFVHMISNERQLAAQPRHTAEAMRSPSLIIWMSDRMASSQTTKIYTQFRFKIRVDKSTQAVKLVCQTLLHAEPGTHTKKNDERKLQNRIYNYRTENL